MKSLFVALCFVSVAGLLSACTYHKVEKREGEREVEIEHEHD